MSVLNISVIKASTVLTDNDVHPVVDALQKQVDNDFGPAWGVDAKLNFVPQGGAPPAGSWWLLMLDDSDQAGALGYHDLTSKGLPLGKVFAATDLKFGANWRVTTSHELLEMLADPNINLTVFIQSDSAPAGCTPTRYAMPVKMTNSVTRSETRWFPTLCIQPGSRISDPRIRRNSVSNSSSHSPCSCLPAVT
ncbi:MAG: hypothetical protein DMG38_24650 [Acidobacteria bacterium]|nr:MAG: hypothetical protein DMG38_24650 [Acidobacteriota bacterium]